MRRSLTRFLQAIVVLIGIGVLALLLWEPTLEGRNVGATLSQIYFNDPFLAYLYLAFVPFFIGLYKTIKALGYAGENKTASPAAVKALRSIRYCALVMAGFIVGAEIWLGVFERTTDDIAGGVAVGMLILIFCAASASVAALFERAARNASQT